MRECANILAEREISVWAAVLLSLTPIPTGMCAGERCCWTPPRQSSYSQIITWICICVWWALMKISHAFFTFCETLVLCNNWFNANLFVYWEQHISEKVWALFITWLNKLHLRSFFQFSSVSCTSEKLFWMNEKVRSRLLNLHSLSINYILKRCKILWWGPVFTWMSQVLVLL